MNTAAVAELYTRIRAALLTEFPELAEDRTALTDTLDGETEAADVILTLVRRAREDEAMAGAAKGMAMETVSRAERLSRRSERSKAAALSLMQAIDRREPIVAPDLTISLRATPQQLVIEDEAAVPEELIRITRSPDKAAIREALKDGPVPGVRLTNGGVGIAVRTR